MQINQRLLRVVLMFFCAPVFGSNMGSIAYDLDTNAYGVAWDHADQSTADSTAIFQCEKNGRDCVVVTRFVNQCGAFAVGQDQVWGSGYGDTRAVAENAALHYCQQHGQGCTIEVWGCNSRPGYGETTQGAPSQAIDQDANRRRAEESRSWGGQEQYDRICRESGGCG